MKDYTNYRGGPYYRYRNVYCKCTCSYGRKCRSFSDGRNSFNSLAHGGMSPVYGRDINGPTAVLKSVSRMDDSFTTNGGLLNMKFLPEFFETERGMNKFENFLRAFVDLEVPHIQFNVVRREDLLDAQNSS